jgi:hypothetical protein
MASTPVQSDSEKLNAWLRQLVHEGGSDLLLVAGAPPSIRVEASLRELAANRWLETKSKPRFCPLSPRADGLRRLDNLVRSVEESRAPLADFDDALAHERAISKSLGGRTVFDDKPKARTGAKREPQLRLF